MVFWELQALDPWRPSWDLDALVSAFEESKTTSRILVHSQMTHFSEVVDLQLFSLEKLEKLWERVFRFYRFKASWFV